MNERGFIRGAVLLLLGIGVLLYFGHRYLPLDFLRQDAGRLNAAINRALTKQGVTDSAVVSQVRLVKGRWGLTWVETARAVVVEDSKKRESVSKALREVAKKQGMKIDIATIGTGRRLLFKQWFIPLETLTLLDEDPHKAKPVLSENRPQVALVIDDVAYDMKAIDRFAALKVPLTFAVLPRHRTSKPLAERAKKLNFAVILHLPMEPLDVSHNNPGQSALYLKMTPEQLRQQFVADVDSVPGIVGINNHMGSAFSSNLAYMKMIMPWVKERGLFFLDSRTTPKSVIPKAARMAGVPCLVNETFLDNEDSLEGIEKQLDQVLRLALKRQRTIAIGHYRRKFIVEALAKKLPEFHARGVQLVPLTVFYEGLKP